MARNEAHFLLPNSLKNHLITYRIGSGSTSYVFRVKSEKTVRAFKVKKQVETSIKTFKDEAKIITTLQNSISSKYLQHLPQIIDYDDNYILFENVYNTLTPNHLTLDTVSSFLDFLAAIHDCGVCHRDIKPASLMYDSKRQCIVLIDFGLAISLTNDAPLAGTITFAAQEFLKSFKFYFFTCTSKYYPKYDIEAFLKTTYCIIHKCSSVFALHNNVPNDVQSLFNQVVQINRVWEDIERSNPQLNAILTKVREEKQLTQQEIQTCLLSFYNHNTNLYKHG